MSKVYIAMVLQEEMQPVWPEARQLQLEQTTNFKHRQARYTAWRLLRYALWEELGLRMEELHFSLEDGKWSCRECYFSITHSGCMVAVAVGHQPVGVDMEKFRRVDPELAKFYPTVSWRNLPRCRRKIGVAIYWMPGVRRSASSSAATGRCFARRSGTPIPSCIP